MTVVSKELIEKMSTEEIKAAIEEAKQDMKYWKDNCVDENGVDTEGSLYGGFDEYIQVCEQVLKEREGSDHRDSYEQYFLGKAND